MSNCYFDGQFGVYSSSYSLNSSSYFLLTYSSWYVLFLSNLFKSPKFGPKNPWEFWNPETQKYTWNQKCIQIFPGFESSKIPSPTDLTRWIWAQACRFRDLATPNEGGEKSWWFFFGGLRNIPFYLREIGKSKFLRGNLLSLPQMNRKGKKMEFTICDGSLS